MKHAYIIHNIKVGDKIPLYGAKKIRIRTTSSYATLKLDQDINIGTTNLFGQIPIQFPVIDGKSPLYAVVSSTGADNLNLQLFIDEIGGVPDEHYWDL